MGVTEDLITHTFCILYPIFSSGVICAVQRRKALLRARPGSVAKRQYSSGSVARKRDSPGSVARRREDDDSLPGRQVDSLHPSTTVIDELLNLVHHLRLAAGRWQAGQT